MLSSFIYKIPIAYMVFIAQFDLCVMSPCALL